MMDHGNIETLRFLSPVLALILWTIVMAFWLLATRIPAMKARRIHPDRTRHKGWESEMPSNARAVAENYNNLHEQPIIFYVLMVFIVLTKGMNSVSMYLAWGYVLSRIIHSLIQAKSPKVMSRFFAFLFGSAWLFALVMRELYRVIMAGAL